MRCEYLTRLFACLLNNNVGVSIGVAVGAGWQSVAAYVNIGSYYLIGIPIGVVLGNLLHLQVKVINLSFT